MCVIVARVCPHSHPSSSDVSEYTHQRSISRPVPSRLALAFRSRHAAPDRRLFGFWRDGRTAGHVCLSVRPLASRLVVANAAIVDAQCYNGVDQFGHRFVSNRRPTKPQIAFTLRRHQVHTPIDSQTLSRNSAVPTLVHSKMPHSQQEHSST